MMVFLHVVMLIICAMMLVAEYMGTVNGTPASHGVTMCWVANTAVWVMISFTRL